MKHQDQAEVENVKFDNHLIDWAKREFGDQSPQVTTARKTAALRTGTYYPRREEAATL
jgi:hypothetical protein